MADRFARDSHLRLHILDGEGHAPGSLAAPDGDAGTARVLRDPKAGAEARPRTRLPPYTENLDDSSIVVRRDDRMAVEEKIREQLIQTDVGLKASPAKPHRLKGPDQSVSYKAIIAITAAVIVIAFGFTALLPSMFTRSGVDPTLTGTLPTPIHPTPIEPFADREPVPVPEQLPASAPPAPVSNDSTSVAKTAPVLDKLGNVPSAQQAGGPVRGAEVIVSGAARAAASRTALTAAEQEAVARGLKELEKTAAINAQPRPAPNRFALTEAEKASVERGLRELEKAAKQAK